MIKSNALFAVCLTFLFLSGCNSKQGPTETPVVDSEAKQDSTLLAAEAYTIYNTYCSGCHGNKLEGTSASALIKSEWTYGRSRGLMMRNIRYGIAGTDMAPYKEILSDEQIRKVVDYIRNQQDTPPNKEVVIPSSIQTKAYELEVQQLVSSGLEVPWAIEFVSKERALISERKGQLRWMFKDQLDPAVISGTPIPHTGSTTGGYMDIAIDPDYEETGWVYLSYSFTKEDVKDKDALATTRIVRAKIKDYQWIDQQILFEVPDSLWVRKGNRWGCRFLFDQQKRLLFTIGDMAQAMDAQDLSKATGKVFRINRDGSIPRDNPFVDQAGALKAIFTLGNRNTQGLAMHPVTGEIWSSDHGPMGGDELNILKAGANYGWPVITYGLDYSGAVVSDKTEQEGMEQALHQWTPSIAVSPIAFLESPLFPAWKNNLLVGALAFEELNRYIIKDNQIIGMERLLKEQGRVRDIKIAPDGSIYVVLNRPDAIIRLLPKPNG